MVGKHLQGLVEGKYRLSPGANLAAGSLVLGVIVLSQCHRSPDEQWSPPRSTSTIQASPQTPPPQEVTSPSAVNPGTGQASQPDEAPLPGERFPETRQHELTDQEISSWNADTVQLALNEMYARHGATFRKSTTTSQFSQLSWYKPVPGRTPEQTEFFFSPIEKANRLKLMGRRTALQQAAHSR